MRPVQLQQLTGPVNVVREVDFESKSQNNELNRIGFQGLKIKVAKELDLDPKVSKSK